MKEVKTQKKTCSSYQLWQFPLDAMVHFQPCHNHEFRWKQQVECNKTMNPTLAWADKRNWSRRAGTFSKTEVNVSLHEPWEWKSLGLQSPEITWAALICTFDIWLSVARTELTFLLLVPSNKMLCCVSFWWMLPPPAAGYLSSQKVTIPLKNELDLHVSHCGLAK
jgi:hypothetical protein